jgi:hypothetical protein
VRTLISNEHLNIDEPEEKEWEAVKLEDGYTLQAIPLKKEKILYIFRDSKGNESGKYEKREHPLAITEMSALGREIKKHLNPKGRLTKEAISRDFETVKQVLNEYYEIQVINEDNEKQLEKENKQLELEEKLTESRLILENKDHPLLYVASLVSWLTAGERINIMLTFIAYASQVILRNPISVIGLGEGGSGKTHIQEVAMQLIPTDFIRHEKSITEAAMFNRAKEDPRYYDGCIVNYGDLGGRNSQDFIMEAKNLLKELQSDGFLNKPLNIPTEDGWKVIDITLYGKPALTYTTVPGFKFDDQEMSRSIFITPRMDNKAVFHARKQIMELKHGRTYKRFKKYRKEIKIVQYMVYLLRERMEELTIINPYTESVIKFLGESEYFKRDFDKYNGILKTITAFNSFNRPIFDLDGEKVLFTSLNDIRIFMSLLRSYHESISVNISPKAAEILEDIRTNIEDWILDRKIVEIGITTNEYFELSDITLSKRSIRLYFGELNRSGFLKVTGKDGSANIYHLSGRVSSDLLDSLLKMSETQKELIKWELNDIALNFILEDAAMDGLDISLQDPDVEIPGWEDYDS